MQKITWIPGDGIGPEVTQSACDIVLASGAAVEFERVEAGLTEAERTGTPLPAAVFESIARNKVIIKGPTQTPFGGDFRVHIERRNEQGILEKRSHPSVAIALRKELGLYVNVRPIRNYPGVESRYHDIDMVIFRENSEDLYTGMERMIDEGTAEAIKIISFRATERVTLFALDYMKRLKRKKLTIGHKANVMKMTDGLFLSTAQDTARGKGFTVDQRVVDAMCMELVMKPETFDCLLLPNLYGDIVSDLAAGLVGGLGVAPGANIGPDCAMFEAVHGSAPDIAGKDIANPMAAILSAVMMLRYIGQPQAADRIDKALTQVLAAKKDVTVDLGGAAGTRHMTDAIVGKLKSA